MKIKKILTLTLGLTLLSSMVVQAASVEPKGEDLEIQTMDMGEDMDMGGNYGNVTVTEVPEYTGGDFTFYVETTNLPKDVTADFPEITLKDADGIPFPGNFLVGNELVTVDTNSGAVTFKAEAFTRMNQAIETAGLENPTMTITGNLASMETGEFLFFELSTTVRTSGEPTETPDVSKPETENQKPDNKPETPEENKVSVTIENKTETWNGTGDITVKVNTNGAEGCTFKGVDVTINDVPVEVNAVYDTTTGVVTIPAKDLNQGIFEVEKQGIKISDISKINLAITFTSDSFESGYSTVNTEINVSDLKDTTPEPIKPETPDTDKNTPIEGEKVDTTVPEKTENVTTETPKVEVKPVTDIPKTGDMSQIATFATTGISSLGVGILAFLKRRK